MVQAYLTVCRGVDVSHISIGEEIMIFILLTGTAILAGYDYLLLMMMGHEAMRHQYHDSQTHQYAGYPSHLWQK